MTNYCILDSDVLIELLNDNEEVTSKILEFGIDSLCISSISASEILLGALNKTDFNKYYSWLNKFIWLEIDSSSNRIYESLIYRYALSHSPKIPDMLIAATAMSNRITLFTLNISDFKFIEGLKLLDHNIKPKRKPLRK